MTELSAENYQVVRIPVDEIWSDDHFNCRGQIDLENVEDLCTDIKRNGLQFPIAVQPIDEVPLNRRESVPPGVQYRIIAGHRRFKAWKVLRDSGNQETYSAIPCMVRKGLDDIQARVLNLSENLKRKELDILQEAKAIESLHQAGVPRDHVAEKLGVSSNWVQVRYYVLALPENVQEEIGKGLFTQAQIKNLYTFINDGDIDGMYAAVKKIKRAKARGEKPINIAKKKAQPVTAKKARNPGEIVDMIELLRDKIGLGLATRSLAWAAGNISTQDLFESVKEYAATYLGEELDFPEEF